jgi:maltooligosyltrehalose trehalohydrolase
VTRRHHRLPFGAEIESDGAVRFRLWAPGARRVAVVLHDSAPQKLEMKRSGDEGFFELVTNAARAGSRYRYQIDDGLEVPDPASRFNPEDIQGPSLVVDPNAFEWTDSAWKGRPWNEAVVYELHVGTFSPEGTFAGVERRLAYLKQLGITFIELMPIADFPGKRGWGYDGVLPFAPEASYGTPEDLKSLINAAHAKGIGVLLDVVYNHFGPEGNYLHTYAPQFFTERHSTPWGAAINFDSPGCRPVRDFFIQNALYWLEEYHFDGLRFDAVDAIRDDSETHILTEIARTVRNGPGRQRHVHLVLENGANEARFLGAPGAPETFDAQWNDDEHHCLHTLLTGESDGYYGDYAQRPHALLCRCLAEGFAYQGEPSAHQGGKPRGERSNHLPPTAFVPFLQNHDQIGNRAFGERLSQLVREDAPLLAATAILLLAPSPPLLFMGEEWAAPEPFLYFCDFEPELAGKVREGRRREFERFERFLDDVERIPDPTSEETFLRTKLDWSKLEQPTHARWLDHYRRLLSRRQRDIVPLIPGAKPGRCIGAEEHGTLAVDWEMGDGSVLHLIANLSPQPAPFVGKPAGRVIFATHPNIRSAVAKKVLEPWSVTWLLERNGASR